MEGDKPQRSREDDEGAGDETTDGFWSRLVKEMKNVRFWIEVLALVGLGVYVCQTVRTNNLTQQALANSKDQFRQDERPYVWITNDIGPFALVPHGPGNTSDKLTFPIRFMNYGKSPAIHVQTDMRIAIGQDAWKSIDWKAFSADQGTILPAGKIDFNSAFSAAPITPQFFQRISTPGIVEYVEVLGHIQYWGTDGTPYSSDFCLGRNPALSMYYCTYHNEIK